MYVPPSVRRQQEEKARREQEEHERREAEERDRLAALEAERLAVLEAARQAGKDRIRTDTEARARKERERREAAAEQRARAAAPSSAPPSAPMSERARLECILEVSAARGSTELKPSDVSAALPTAQHVSALDERRALAVFGSAVAARQALRDEVPRTFRLRAVTADSTGAVRGAALALEVTPEQRPQASVSTAARLITGNLTLSKEESVSARSVAAEKRRDLLASKERAKAEDRRRREAADAVWDEDE